MKIGKTTLLLSAVSAVSLLGLSEASALRFRVINGTNDTTHIFVLSKDNRGKEGPLYQREVIPANTLKSINVDETKIGIIKYYDVMAAGSAGDPDWKLTGGTCQDLDKDNEEVILIESSKLGLKYSCKTIHEM